MTHDYLQSRDRFSNLSPLVSARGFVLFAGLIATCFGSPSSSIAQTALDAYVAAPDTSYGITPVATLNGPGYTGYHIDLKSQTWRNPSEIRLNLWQHKMTITQPDLVVSSNTTILLIDGGNNPDNFQLFPEAAVGAGLTFVHLPAVPNQPIRFAGETFTRRTTQ